MKIYFISKKSIIKTTGTIVLMAVALFIVCFFYLDDLMTMGSNDSGAIFQGNTGKKVVALTVNVDWGEEFIPQMLNYFDKYEAKVTFFVTGKWAEKNPELLKEMSQAGHSIQNHGYQHIHFNKLSSEQGAAEIKKAENVIEKIINKKTCFFASPYGEFEKQVVNAAKSIDYHLIMWSIDTVDWKKPEPATIVNRVASKLHNDAIILMHPTEPTLKALPDLLAKIQEQGYKMITIEELIIGQSENN